ncbi:MAG: WGR domain-containing protein [Kofleriaceae bacterium]
MPRYEFSEGTSNKFWEIELSGKQYTARWGRIGATGRNEKTQTFADAAAAKKAHDKLVAEKTKKGYALVGKPGKAGKVAAPAKSAKPAKPAKPDPKLEAIVADNLGDAGSWQVYADWMLQHGEPWGEVIVGACTGKRVKKQQDEAAAAMIGALDGSSIKWKFGSVEEVSLCPEESHEDGSTVEGEDPPMVQALRRVLAHPAGRLARKLTLGLPPDADIGWSFDDIIPVIVKAGPLPFVHTIDMSKPAEHMDQDSWRRIGDLRKLWAAVPRLREIRMLGAQGRSGKACVLGAIDAPHLETFVFESGGLDKSIPIDLGKAKLPALRHLELWFGRPDYGNNGSVKSLAGILDGKGLPKLEYLGLMNSEWEKDLIAAVANSAIVKRIKTLDLSMGTLYTEGGEALLAHAAKFRHLTKLLLGENFLTPEHAKAIKKAIPCADVGSQREPDEYDDEMYRFTVMGE